MIDTSVILCGIKLKNPIILASGILGISSELLVNVAKAGAGAVTSKSCGLLPRAGHPNPTVLEWEHGLINAVGLSNPGIEEEIKELKKAKIELKKIGVPLVASFFADKVDNFALLAEKLSEAEPDFLEVNISCPNTESDLGRMFAAEVKTAAAVTRVVKKRTKIPLIVKLSPNVTDIKEIAKAVEEAGADTISAINTVGPGMFIDIESGQPILANKVGGLSGPAIRPIAIAKVFEICSVVKIPVIGIGGINSGKDAIEIMMAGASAVGVGSAIYYRGIKVFAKINQEIKKFMKDHQFQKLSEFKGVAHKN